MTGYVDWLIAHWMEVAICMYLSDRSLQILTKIASRTKYTWDDKAVEVLHMVVDSIKGTLAGLIRGDYKKKK